MTCPHNLAHTFSHACSHKPSHKPSHISFLTSSHISSRPPFHYTFLLIVHLFSSATFSHPLTPSTVLSHPTRPLNHHTSYHPLTSSHTLISSQSLFSPPHLLPIPPLTSSQSLPPSSLQVRVFDVFTYKLSRRFSGHSREISDMAFAPDGRRLLTASLDSTVSDGELSDQTER